MRRPLRFLAATLLILSVTNSAQPAVVFQNDTTFVDGDDYFSVEIHGDAHAEVLGGLFRNRFQLYDDSTAHLVGGDFRGSFAMQDSSIASIHPGTYINTYIYMLGSAELDIYGGRMPDRFLDATAWGGQPIITFHGRDLLLDPMGGSQGDGIVTGTFADGSPFVVHLRGENTASRIRLADTTVIPEPTTFVIWSLLGVIGTAACWRRRRRA